MPKQITEIEPPTASAVSDKPSEQPLPVSCLDAPNGCDGCPDLSPICGHPDSPAWQAYMSETADSRALSDAPLAVDAIHSNPSPPTATDLVQTSTLVDKCELLVNEIDSIIIPADNAETYPELWKHLDGYRGMSDILNGFAAWQQGEMLNRVKPVPRLEREGWSKAINHGDFESKFLPERGVSKSQAWLLRTIRAEHTREQARVLGLQKMRENVIGKRQSDIEDPHIDYAAVERTEKDWVGPSALTPGDPAQPGHPTPPTPGEPKKPFDIADVPSQLSKLKATLTDLRDKLRDYQVGPSDMDRATARAIIRDIRIKLHGKKSTAEEGLIAIVGDIKAALATMAASVKKVTE